ncbi:hypothetical protein NQ318_014282 [Aromia moschata]|uniref:Phospholipid/glycerol acyltransferase domain-containing protein n=1 Tax=Aromia moschata TaxID=1265417 RepID=A0AAV8Z1E1_9CUCU|nr:hypothetical protein NQ318_014282 [Aromia moschata]
MVVGYLILLYVDKYEFDKYYGKEHAYCVMNHTYEVDWLIGWMTCDRIHLLGNCKAYAKKVVKYIPVLGWAWKFSEFVFLERSFDKDKEIINKQITELAEHPDPIWVTVTFSRGDEIYAKKHEASIEFAQKNNLPQLKYHLLPRTRGFIASLAPMKGKVPALYDIELCFKEDDPVKPTMTNMLFGKPLVAHMYMKRIPMEDVPTTEAEQEKFLRDMFIGKDKLKESFIKTGDFFATSGVSRIEPFELPRRIYSLINIIVWQLCTLVPISYYLIKLLFSGELLYFSIGAAIIGTCMKNELFNEAVGWSAFEYAAIDISTDINVYLLLNKTIGMSEIKKGSSYGTSSATPKRPSNPHSLTQEYYNLSKQDINVCAKCLDISLYCSKFVLRNVTIYLYFHCDLVLFYILII